MLQDKQVALITGANRGIGFEMVKQLASMGFKVILASRDTEKGAEAAQGLAESGLDVSFVVMDVTDQESIRKAAISITETIGRLDVLINNAGVYLDGSARLLTMEPAILEHFSAFIMSCVHFFRSWKSGDMEESSMSPLNMAA